MGIDATLTRVGQLQQMIGSPAASAAGSAATAAAAGRTRTFDVALAQQVRGPLPSSAAPPAGAGSATGPRGAALQPIDAPFLSVADHYRAMGVAPRMAADPATWQRRPASLPVGSSWSTGAAPSIAAMPSSGGATGERIVALARAELGVREQGSSNESPRIREYRRATAGAENVPGPWCAYFVSWAAAAAGSPIGEGGKGTGWVPTIESWGKSAGRFVEPGTRPQPGDIVIFDWQGDGTADHTGFVERVAADGTIHTIEGNSSNMVRRRSYLPDVSSIRGYVRP